MPVDLCRGVLRPVGGAAPWSGSRRPVGSALHRPSGARTQEPAALSINFGTVRKFLATLGSAMPGHRLAWLLLAVFAVLASVQLGRLTATMIRPPEEGEHSCLTAYVEAAELARAGDPNLYSASHYEAFADENQVALLPPAAYDMSGKSDPMHTHAVRIESNLEREVFGSLRCTCGCPRGPQDLLSTCACGFAEAARAKIREQLALGMNKHQVLAAYVATNGPHVLAVPQPGDPETAVAHMQPFLFDAYEYPPPFLIVPRVLLAVTNDYRIIRTLRFFVQALAIGALSIAVARWIGGTRGLVAGLALPALWGAGSFLNDLQSGQVHMLVLALAMAGMAAFERRRDILGGSLLGAAVVTKLVPGLLLVYMLARGRIRSVLAAMAWIVAYGILGLLVLGPAPYVAFVRYQLPRLASGEAFAFFLGRPSMLAGNFSLYALPLKLRGLGVPGMTLGLSSAVTLIYTLVLIGTAVVAARRGSRDRLDDAQRWLALLNLAALRSPLAPLYATSGSVWLLTLLAPEARTPRLVSGLIIAWLYLSVGLLVGIHDPLRDGLVGQLVVLTFNMFVALRSSGPLENHSRPFPLFAADG
jgi:hypothetical protein